MKRFIFIPSLLSLLVLTACTQSEFMSDSEIEKSDNGTDCVTSQSPAFQKALQMATEAVDFLQPSESATAVEARQIDTEHTRFITRPSRTRSEGEDTLIYVFNYADNEGFAVIPACDVIDGPLAVIESGHFSTLEECQNDGFKLFMELAEDYVETAMDAGQPTTRAGGGTGPEILEDYMVEIDTVVTTYSPMIVTKWDQHEPYNKYCPYDGGGQCLAGCVAVALAQILSYHQYPTSWTLTYASGNPTINVDWTTLRQNASCIYCINSSFCSTHDPIAKIIRQIGKDVFTVYGSDGSSSNFLKTKIALLLWGYSSDNIQDYSISEVQTSIRNHRPVLIGGLTEDEEHGHTWVIDGMIIREYTFHEYTRPFNSLTWRYQGCYTSTYNYFHFNWGGRGDCDGYFRAGVFNTQNSVNYDPGCTHNTSVNYNTDLKIIPNIHR